MTEKQLENLNVKIARKLGWKNFRKERTPPSLNTRRTTGIAPNNIRHQFVPFFTNNLSYSLQLVDWAVKEGYRFQLTKRDDPHYEVSFFDGRVEEVDFGTLPSMAICMAFLKIK